MNTAWDTIGSVRRDVAAYGRRGIILIKEPAEIHIFVPLWRICALRRIAATRKVVNIFVSIEPLTLREHFTHRGIDVEWISS